MNLLEKSDDEIIAIAKPIWDNLVKTSNMKDYGGFTKDFGTQMLFGANEVELGNSGPIINLLTSLSEDYEAFGCLRRGQNITVLFKQRSKEIEGEFLRKISSWN